MDWLTSAVPVAMVIAVGVVMGMCDKRGAHIGEVGSGTLRGGE
jgi:hypothetical protein